MNHTNPDDTYKELFLVLMNERSLNKQSYFHQVNETCLCLSEPCSLILLL